MPPYGFLVEYPSMEGDHTYDGFDDYLRIEFGRRHPDWAPRFGRMTWWDRAGERYNHAYLLTGDVPDARSQEEAEKKVIDLVEELARGFKNKLPGPVSRVWKRAA